MDDAELLTEWQRRNAEFKQRKKIAGAMGAADKAQRMKAFQMRLRVGKSAAAEAAAAATAPKADGEAAGDQVTLHPNIYIVKDKMISIFSRCRNVLSLRITLEEPAVSGVFLPAHAVTSPAVTYPLVAAH